MVSRTAVRRDGGAKEFPLMRAYILVEGGKKSSADEATTSGDIPEHIATSALFLVVWSSTR
jgi:hypothetical protein